MRPSIVKWVAPDQQDLCIQSLPSPCQESPIKCSPFSLGENNGSGATLGPSTHMPDVGKSGLGQRARSGGGG